MASITDTDLAIGTAHRGRRPFRAIHALYRLLRRGWRRRLWAARMYGELGDDRLLADIGVAPGGERQRMTALARLLGASSRREI